MVAGGGDSEQHKSINLEEKNNDRCIRSAQSGNAEAWSDAEFKKQLIENPGAVLAGLGIEPPAGMEGVNLKVVENTADTVHLVLPVPPTEGELSDDELDGVAGGGIEWMGWRNAW